MRVIIDCPGLPDSTLPCVVRPGRRTSGSPRGRLGAAGAAILMAWSGLAPLSGSQAKQPAPAPEKFTEALVYARFARESFTCEMLAESKLTDPTSEAVKWTKQAIATARKFKSTDKQRMGRLREFIGRQETDLAFYRGLHERLDRALKKIEPAMNFGYLLKAEALLPKETPACDIRFQRLRPMVEEKRKLFNELTNRANLLRLANPPEALAIYRSAAAINREDRELAAMIRELERR